MRRFAGSFDTSWRFRASCLKRAHPKGRPTRKWSRRARRFCAILSPRRAAHLQRWTDEQRPRNTDQLQTKKTHLASPSVGVGCIRSEFVSCDMALSGGGAAVIGLLGRQGPVAGRAVGGGHVLNRSPGHVDPADAGSAVGAPSHSGNAGDSIRRGSFAGPSCGLNPRTGSHGTVAVNGW